MAITIKTMNNSELLKFAQSNLIESLKAQLDTLEEYIRSEQKALSKLTPGEPSHEMSYKHLYTMNYKKAWLLSKLYDIEVDHEDSFYNMVK
jgi:hypothetical protein